MNIWVLLTALAVAGGLIALLAGMFLLAPAPTQASEKDQAVLTLIPAPTSTPTSVGPTATPTPQPGEVRDGVAVGMYVQISGTGGDGLRLRADAGVKNDPRFLGMENEVFKVKEGPKEGDGFIWWRLEAPYDPTRSGWAVSTYLKAVTQPPAQPTVTTQPAQ